MVAETYVQSSELKNIDCISSGVCVDLDDPTERGYFQNTIKLLERHGISKYAKSTSDQLTQERVDCADITICVNRRAFEEASEIVVLPENTIVWDIVDIGEGARVINKDILATRIGYEEEIYKEIAAKVSTLVTCLF